MPYILNIQKVLMNNFTILIKVFTIRRPNHIFNKFAHGVGFEPTMEFSLTGLTVRTFRPTKATHALTYII